MPAEAERLFVGLKVNEISLVDEPANEKEIIVAKRKDQAMSTPAAQETPAAEAPTNTPAAAADIETVKNAVDDDASDETVDAVKQLVENVLKLSKADGKGGKKAGGNLPPFLKAMEAKLKKGGMDEKQVAQAMDAAKASFGASGIAADEPVKKAAAEAPAPAPAFDNDELVMGVLEAISKAKSFTPSRIKKLVELSNNMDSLLDELGIDKASFGASGIAATGTATLTNPGIKDTAASGGAGKPGNSIKKSATDEAQGGLTAEGIAQAVAKAMQPLADRIESIEKARSPSTQPAEGDPEVKTEKSKSAWAGVL